MKVSIITVCYNAAETIESTIESVSGQNYPDVEHIVVDGCSTDGTLDVVSSHRGKIDKFISEPDEGIYDAMNKGLELASGEIIGLLNADDIYADETVIKRAVEMMRDKDLDALYADVEFFSKGDVYRPVRRYSSANFSPANIAKGAMLAHPTLFLRREVYQRFGKFRTDYRISGDFEFVARIFRDGSLRYFYLPEVLVKMRMGGISTSGFGNTVLLNREVLRACQENGIQTSMLKILSKYPLKLKEFMACKWPFA